MRFWRARREWRRVGLYASLGVIRSPELAVDVSASRYGVTGGLTFLWLSASFALARLEKDQ